MIKAHFIAGMIAVMSMSAAPSLPRVGAQQSRFAERDTRIIVEVNRSLEGLSEKEIKSSQDNVLRSIRHNVTSNIELVNRYNVLNNAFTIEINSNAIEAVKELPGVKSVTVDKLHARKAIGSGSTYSASLGPSVASVEENISATTMKKPTDTNDGEGTVIAILDNEFFFRGRHTEKEDCAFHKFESSPGTPLCDGSPINHEVFDDLDPGVRVRFTYDNLKSLTYGTSAKTHARRKSSSIAAGDEGSLYFNRKVPFYYDYGGESTSYGKAGKMDYDVSSIITYHGSHVASITGANAPTYKGIAPKAQLACMKVFTNYKADDTAKNLGFGDSSGAYDSCILAALEDCIALGVDGINMSLGSDLDDFDSDSIAMKTLVKLSEQGIMSSISAGNSGKASYSFAGAYGNWTTDMVETGILGSYANGIATTSVASGQPTEIFYKNAISFGANTIAYDDQVVNREGFDAEFSEEYRLEDVFANHTDPETYHAVDFVYVGGFGTQTDYDKFSAGHFENKVAIVNRGSTSFADKYATAVANEAAGLIVINNDPTATDFNFRMSFGDGFSPSIPCALVLFKDKAVFDSASPATFSCELVKDQVRENDAAYTLSTFSTDGARFDLDLKPEITAPGDNIKGAVPPQTKEHKLTPLSSYEYLSGTSMSAPNHAGAQSVLLSKKAKDAFASAPASAIEYPAELLAYRKTVDMRIQSTADPMKDYLTNPEDGDAEHPVYNYSSPRIQGAGMVDIGGAYNTEVYLEGYADDGQTGLNKSKVLLKNNSDIAKGDVKISFLAHSEATTDKTYNVKLTVMRPAIIENNEIPTKDYNYRTEVSDKQYLPGISYYDYYSKMQRSSSGKAAVKDVFKVSQDIEYYKSQQDYEDDWITPGDESSGLKHETSVKLPKGMYYVKSISSSGTSNAVYETLPGYKYQSTQDKVLFSGLTGQSVVIAGKSGDEKVHDTKVTINTYSLTAEQKAAIAENYPYGCMIEGFVELVAADSETPDLNIPYLGFYSGEGHSYKDAPVVEPFSFEKDPSTIYPSDLVNNVAKTLVGKDKGNMESMWVVGYSENPAGVNTEQVLANDSALDLISGFHRVGTDPLTGAQGDTIYVGNPSKTNTMLIQQFVLRSVNDNFFTIKNAQGEIVYKSVLEDMLFGDQYGRYPLYKSHVDGGYLSAGYIAHRAYAAIPLFNTKTNEPFADGTYTIEFNYQLIGCSNEWVSKSYQFVVDSTAPEFVGVSEYTNDLDEKMVRFEFKDKALSYGIMGYQLMDCEYDEQKQVYYMEATKEEVLAAIDELGATSSGQKRLYLKAVDKAYGETGVVIHFEDASENGDLSKLVAVQGEKLRVNHDFSYTESQITFIEIDESGAENIVSLSGVKPFGFEIKSADNGNEKKSNLGLILGLSIGGGVAVLGGAGVLVYFLLKKKKPM